MIINTSPVVYSAPLCEVLYLSTETDVCTGTGTPDSAANGYNDNHQMEELP